MDFSSSRVKFILYHSVNLTLNNNIEKRGGVEFKVCYPKVDPKTSEWVKPFTPNDPVVLELELDSTNFQYEYDHEFVYPLDEIMKGNNTAKLLLDLVNSAKGIQDIVSQKTDMGGKSVFNPGASPDRNLGSQMVTSVYQKAPAYKSTSELKLPSNLTFKFYYGQKGMFNGFYEVVYPIMCLFSFFLPTNIQGALGELPLPTSAQVLANATIGVLQKVSPAPVADGGVSSLDPSIDVDIGIENTDNSGGENSLENQNKENTEIFQKVSQVVENVNKILPTVYQNYKGICRGELTFYATQKDKEGEEKPAGFYKTPIFSFKNVSCKMDFSKLDSQGYPLAGTFTLGGVSSLSVAVREVL